MLCEGIPAYKMYVNMPGYDLIAVGRQGRQGVGEDALEAKGFIIRNFDSDFVVVVKLNKGGREPSLPEMFVIPTHVVEAAPRDGQWGKLLHPRLRLLQGRLAPCPRADRPADRCRTFRGMTPFAGSLAAR